MARFDVFNIFDFIWDADKFIPKLAPIIFKANERESADYSRWGGPWTFDWFDFKLPNIVNGDPIEEPFPTHWMSNSQT